VSPSPGARTSRRFHPEVTVDKRTFSVSPATIQRLPRTHHSHYGFITFGTTTCTAHCDTVGVS
jgi:hypothetical protein